MSLELNIKLADNKRELKVKPRGELDIFHSAAFKKEIVREMEQHDITDVSIDGNDLSYVDSTGLGVLMFLVKEVEKKGGKLKMTNVKKNVAKLLVITKMDSFIDLEGNISG